MPLKVIMVSTDRNIFDEKSAVRARMLEYAGLFEELHIIVFSRREAIPDGKLRIAGNAFVYSTESVNRCFYVRDAVRIGRSLVVGNSVNEFVVSSQDPFETGWAGYRIAKAGKAKFHVQIHTDFLNPYFKAGSLLNRVRVLLARWLLPKADGIRVVSQRIFDSLAELGIKNYELRTGILPIFVDIQAIRRAPVVVDLEKKYPQFNFILLMASRFAKEKHIELAFVIVKSLIAKYSDIGLVVVGSGPLEACLKADVVDLGLGRSVVFEPWQSDLSSYYKTADLFLSTSSYEGFGMSLVEAVAAGTPVVATDAGIAPLLLQDENVSYVCPVGDASCVTEKVSRLLEDGALRRRVAGAFFANLEKLVSASKEAYLEAYRKSLADLAA